MGFFDRFKKAAAPAKPEAITTEYAPGVVAAPVAGTLDAMEASPDPVFAGKAMGDGCIVKPSGEVVYAPVAGTVTASMPHAVGLMGDDEAEVLIHIGIDTVNMKGEGFTVHVAKGDHVEAGTPLVSFSKAAIKKAGYDDTVMCIITNTDDYATVELAAPAGTAVEAGKAAVKYAK